MTTNSIRHRHHTIISFSRASRCCCRTASCVYHHGRRIQPHTRPWLALRVLTTSTRCSHSSCPLPPTSTLPHPVPDSSQPPPSPSPSPPPSPSPSPGPPPPQAPASKRPASLATLA